MYAYKHVEYSTVMRGFWAVRGMHIRDSTRILCEVLQQAERQGPHRVGRNRLWINGLKYPLVI